MSTTTLQDLKPSQVKPHKNNPRRDVGDVTELAASIREQGVVEPLIVAPNGTGATFVLLAGHRRLAAAKAARLKTIPCLVRDDLADDPAKQIELMLVENLQRTDLSPIEEAEAYQQLLEFPGYTQTKLAETTGRAIATVRARLKIAKLPPNALRKIHEGQISLTEAAALTDFAGDERRYARLERTAGTDSFARALNEVRAERSNERKDARLRKQLEAEGVRIIDAPPMFGDSRGRKQLFGDEDVAAHRDCPGFAAYVTASSYFQEPSVRYVCDQPGLHADADTDTTATGPVGQQQAERQAELDALAEAAAVRRAWIGAEVLNRMSDGLALDMLRAVVTDALEFSAPFLAHVIGWSPADDKKARAARIQELTLPQLACVLDLNNHAAQEHALTQLHCWDRHGYGYKDRLKWLDRLTTLYGYTLTSHEQALLDANAAADAADQAAAAAGNAVDGDDAGDELEQDDE